MELVVYVTLVAMLTIVVTDAVLSLSRSFRATRVTRALENSGLTSLDRLARGVRLADSVGNGSIFNSTSSKLVLEYSGAATTTKEFSLDGNQVLRLKENDQDQGPLTSENLTVTSFMLERATTTKSEIIRVTLSLKDRDGGEGAREATFYTAAVTRNTY